MKVYGKKILAVLILLSLIAPGISQGTYFVLGAKEKYVATDVESNQKANEKSNNTIDNDEDILVHGLTVKGLGQKKPNGNDSKPNNKNTKISEEIKKTKKPNKPNKKVEKKSKVEPSWHLKTIKVENVQNSATKNKIKVALIDSGVNYTEDVEVTVRKNFVPDEDDVSYLYEDISEHGTSIASILCSSGALGVDGVNPNIELYSAKVLDSNEQAPVNRVADAIYWAIEQNVKIINMSFGTDKDSVVLKQAVQDANDAGILIIAAAGNNGTVQYPAAYDEVIAVGSVDSMGNVSDFSPAGEKIEIVAPGEDIITVAAFGGVTKHSGTSLSALIVTGIASILWERDTAISADFIRQLLDYSANLYGDSDIYGNGLVDLNYALEIYDEFKEIYNLSLNDTNVQEDESSLVNDTADTEESTSQKDATNTEENESQNNTTDTEESIPRNDMIDTEEGIPQNDSTNTEEDIPQNDTTILLENIPPNNTAIEVYESVNSDYVEGSWYSNTDTKDPYGNSVSGHTQLIPSASSASISADERKAMLYGCTYPDTSPSTVSGMTDNPQWHGYLWDSSSNNNNYIYCYIYLTRIANAFNKGSLVSSVTKPGTMSAREVNGIKNVFTDTGVGSWSWATIFNKDHAYINDTPAHRMAFVYGMAAHTATDVFSHSTFTNDGKRIVHVSKETNPDWWETYTDNPQYIAARYAVAGEVAKKVAIRCGSQKNGTNTGTSYDFVVNTSYFGSPNFRVGNFNYYANNCNCPTIYSNYSANFLYANINK